MHGRQRKISTYYSDHGEGYAEVWMDFKEELAFIKYFDDNDTKFFEEDFPNKTSKDQVSTLFYSLFSKKNITNSMVLDFEKKAFIK